MKELQNLDLFYYEGVSLPNCICQFQNLKNLNLSNCMNLKGLPALEIGSEAACDSFPKLEELDLHSLSSLEIIVWNAKTMPQLQILRISGCCVLKTLKMKELPNLSELSIADCAVLKTLRMKELPNLRELHIADCAELKELFMDSGGSFPKLEKLRLSSLDNLNSIVWNAKTMSRLQSLAISYCRVLKALRIEELPKLRRLEISVCVELKELFLESGGNFPELQTLNLSSPYSLEINTVCNEKTMPQLYILDISSCLALKALRIEELPRLRKLSIQCCAELKELFMESGGGFPKLEELYLDSLDSLENIVCNGKTMPQLHFLRISGCSVLKTLKMEELCSLRELEISDCAELKELKELFMESSGGFPELKILNLSSLHSLEISMVCNAKTMPQLYILDISNFPPLKALRIEEVPNLESIWISWCSQLEVEIDSLPMLRELHVTNLKKAESIARPSSVWNEETMPNLEVLVITGCPLLRRMPKEMEKLLNLKEIVGELHW